MAAPAVRACSHSYSHGLAPFQLVTRLPCLLSCAQLIPSSRTAPSRPTATLPPAQLPLQPAPALHTSPSPTHGPGVAAAPLPITPSDAAPAAMGPPAHAPKSPEPTRHPGALAGSASRDGGGSVDNARNGGFTAAAANASDGVSALEAELRDVQAQLQARAAEGGFGTWEDSGESSCDNVEGGWDWRSEGSSGGSSVGWQQAGQRRGGQSRRGASASAAAGSPAKSGRKIVVQNIAPELVHSQLLPFFKQ